MPSPTRIERHVEPAASGQTGNAYFRRLTVENVRCFYDAQDLVLETSNGEPARWTLILGDNGVGTTTLLQLLALGVARADVLWGNAWGGATPPRTQQHSMAK